MKRRISQRKSAKDLLVLCKKNPITFFDAQQPEHYDGAGAAGTKHTD
jgi:hypothetical protein